MPKYIADVLDHLSWRVEFEAPDGLSQEELMDRALEAWGDDDDAPVSTLRYSSQEVLTVVKLPE